MVPGSEQLKHWMKWRGLTQRQASALLGWDETYVSRLVSGERLPELDNALRLKRLTGIPVEAWRECQEEAS